MPAIARAIVALKLKKVGSERGLGLRNICHQIGGLLACSFKSVAKISAKGERLALCG
jgi:hypothetical protein